jgi:Tfp pilus assembly protein PilO
MNLVKLKKLSWVLIFLLVPIISIEIIDIVLIHQKGAITEIKNVDQITDKIAPLQRKIERHTEYINNLERYAVWSSEPDPISWVAQQAIDANVEIVGLEYSSVEKISEYKKIPVDITIRGNYNTLGRFINKLEHSQNAIKINSLRAICKDSTPEQITANLNLSYFQKADKI